MGDDFDDKADLKSPKRVGTLGDEIIKDFHRQLAKKKAVTFADLWNKALAE
jgi:hypothetical protein